MAVGVRGAELLPDSSSQAPLNDGRRWDLDGRATSGRPYDGGALNENGFRVCCFCL